MIYAALGLVVHPRIPNLYMAVARKNDPEQSLCCFPGGKIEEGETPIETCVREVFEETGQVVYPCYPEIHRPYKSRSVIDPDYTCYTYLCKVLASGLSYGTSWEPDHGWVRMQAFLDSPYKEYNEGALRHFRLL